MLGLHLLLGFGILSHSLAANIVMLPMFGGSHYMVMAKLGEELVKRGHKVAILIGNTEKGAIKKPYSVVFEVDEFLHSSISSLTGVSSISSVVAKKVRAFTKNAQKLLEVQFKYCSTMLDNKQSLETIKNADVIIGDSVYQCSSLVAAKFSLPHVIIARRLTSPFLLAFGMHNPPSYVPQLWTGFTDKMRFLQRVQNSFHALGMYILFYVYGCPAYEEMKTKHNIAPNEGIGETLGRVDLILVQLDFPMEVPRPLLPNTKVVGPFTPGPAKTLNPELEEFMQSSADNGVILVSFGSIMHSLDKSIVHVMATAFSKLPQNVIWKIQQEHINFPLGKNIKTMSWIPQNDILGHSKVKLFVGHGGINSLFESIYHGVPLVIAPIGLDQPSNADMAKHNGIAEQVDINSITAEELVQVMRTVMTQVSYKENVVRLSKLIKLKPRPPVSEAADWVEYLLAVGSLAHLRPRELDMPFYQLYMLDVMLAAVVFLLVVLLIVRSVISCIVSRFVAVVSKEKNQ